MPSVERQESPGEPATVASTRECHPRLAALLLKAVSLLPFAASGALVVARPPATETPVASLGVTAINDASLKGLAAGGLQLRQLDSKGPTHLRVGGLVERLPALDVVHDLIARCG